MPASEKTAVNRNFPQTFRNTPLAAIQNSKKMSRVNKSIFLSAFASFLVFLAPGQAALTGFEDYELGGVTASWDIFYGANYLQVFEFETGTAGNPILNSATNLTLQANVTSWKPGPPMPGNLQATGPVGSNQDIPGDREDFYTFFSTNIDWSIAGSAESAFNTFVFQVHVSTGSNGALQNVAFNGLSASIIAFDEDTGIGVWTWSNLNVLQGNAYDLTWNTGTHTALDAFQVQMGVVPEPSTIVLFGIGLAVALGARRRFACRKC